VAALSLADPWWVFCCGESPERSALREFYQSGISARSRALAHVPGTFPDYPNTGFVSLNGARWLATAVGADKN
jgi:hypothetical protein